MNVALTHSSNLILLSVSNVTFASYDRRGSHCSTVVYHLLQIQ